MGRNAKRGIRIGLAMLILTVTLTTLISIFDTFYDYRMVLFLAAGFFMVDPLERLLSKFKKLQ
jgi:hypothetical protein